MAIKKMKVLTWTVRRRINYNMLRMFSMQLSFHIMW